MTGLRLQIMGPLRVWRGDLEIDLGPRQQRCLLAVLLANVGHPVSVADLTASIWGLSAPPSAVNVIHKYVGALRRLLEPELALRTPGSYLLRTAGGYRLAAGPEVLDLAAFRELIAESRALDGTDRPGEALDRYADALRLCHGPAGDALAESAGAAATFAAIDGEFCDAAIAAADVAFRLRRPAPVLGPLRLAATLGTLNEFVHARLITALAMAGRQAEALSTYRTIRQRLADDLGIDPGQTLEEAHRRVLTQDLPAPADSPPGREIPHLVRPAQLPPDLPSFAGRAPEIATLDTLVAGMDRDGRTAPLIVALDGMGGVGKSTLAAHVAHRHAGRFTDGQLYLDLRGDLDDEDLLAGDALAALLYGLGVPTAQLPGTFDARVGAYRSLTAGRRILVLLDNVHDPAQVRPLLPNSAHSLVLLTSRSPLLGLAAFDGAHLLRVDVPDPASAQELVLRRLPGPAPADLVDEIAELCGRLPLALAILAARLAARPTLSLESVAAELRDSDRRLQAFPAGTGTPDPRTAFAWSYRQLSAGAARLFRLLSAAFTPAVTAGTAAGLTGDDPSRTRSDLEELAAAALIDEHDDGRFVVHVLVRAYAEELLDTVDGPAEREAAVGRLLRHYLDAGLDAQAALAPAGTGSVPAGTRPDIPVTVERAAAWFAGHRQELTEAVRVAADRGDADTAWSLAGALRLAHPSVAGDAARYVRASLQSRPNAAPGSSTAPSA
ncbi:hypothetical protein Aph02nite_00320 [Actinoplanes philippinensis]|uniref:DNA-binding transcriptional activator of the SARP family n=1 Tax=Actinoplanes philippinensis TaxID=35752 RepID=A0A1I2HM36_9ACTN|nr:AfsR/SARP family transcriptional regulator [Actinoplanes philippinensis]GIE74082.1 hypothetical protein Aph02nite_00320 [Actinoplanes philippinensis]SFF30330.1 DNA-binding transcriptional activator of the SARP family [Actinoplanes philippinensis]